MATDRRSGVEPEFTPIVSDDLKPIAVVAQCLDNQWVRQDLLSRMLRDRLSFDDKRINKRRLIDARTEYLRALLNAEQVVVNRAFFYNNPVVYQDFRRPGQARETFKNLMNTHVVVPFLLSESSPAEPPSFTTDAAGWSAWEQVLREMRPQCVRLSWDDAENRRYVDTNMFQSFRRFVGGLGLLDPAALAVDLQLDREGSRELLRRLKAVTVWTLEEEKVNREVFYKEFVVADGTDPAKGCYDNTKPFAAELKQLADLKYAVSLPDVLDRFPLTPADSLHRIALQEERQIKTKKGGSASADLVEALLRRQAFDLVQRPLAVSLAGLDLPSVWTARHTEEWARYIAELRTLREHPESFAEQAQAVYDSYVALAGHLARIVGDRRKHTGPAWSPVIKVIVEVLGAALTIVYSTNPYVEVTGEVSEKVGGMASDAVVRFVVAGHDRRVARNEMATGIELAKTRFTQTKAEWLDLIARLSAAGLPVRRVEPIKLVEDSGIDGTGVDGADET